ncbi:hypothetical protein ACFYWU_41125 [Streptomyces chrestomyceticus]|uniref:hypothetical protein n=1 Tax=Streptomyces chrestomyceticus TaxID=68185 RepID=UPI0036950FA2
MPLAYLDDPEDAVTPQSPARYRIRPRVPGDEPAVRALVETRQSPLPCCAPDAEPRTPAVLSGIRSAGAPLETQVWVLYECELLRGCVAVTTAPTTDTQLAPADGPPSLWLREMYTDPEARPDRPGRWMAWWLGHHYHRARSFVCATTACEPLARKISRSHVMDLHTTGDTRHPYLLRRATRRAPHIARYIDGSDPDSEAAQHRGLPGCP